MKVKIAFNVKRLGFKTPRICCSCANNIGSKFDEILCLKQERSQLYTWKFKFPYCPSCYEKIRKTKIFKDRVRSVNVTNVQKQKYGKFLRKKTLPYIEFTFKNDRYAELFKKANQDILFDTVLNELKKQ